MGVDSAQQIIAEVGPAAATFPSEKCLCPGSVLAREEESAGVNHSHRSAQGNRHMRRLLIKLLTPQPEPKEAFSKSYIAAPVPRLGHNQAIGVIAHRQCRLIWLILHQRVRYEERNPAGHQAIEATSHLEDDPGTCRHLGYRSITETLTYQAQAQ